MRLSLFLGVVLFSIEGFSCTFPVIELGSGGHGSSTSQASTAVGSTSSAASTSATTSTTTTTVAASSGTGADCLCLMTTNCDCDGDHVERYNPTHGCTNVPDDMTQDCNDCDPTIFPGQMGYFATPGENNFDYNCNGSQEPKYVEDTCGAHNGLVTGGCPVYSFLELSASCGSPVTIDTCKNDVLPTSPCLVDSTKTMTGPLPCH